jgi:hypothetical protein
VRISSFNAVELGNRGIIKLKRMRFSRRIRRSSE